eukprot:15365259-Ditylum_brightwellii.AAC.1
MTIIGAGIIDPVKKGDIDAWDEFIPLQCTENVMDLTKRLSLDMRNITGGKEKKVMVDAIICKVIGRRYYYCKYGGGG